MFMTDGPGRRQLLAIGATMAPWLFLSQQSSTCMLFFSGTWHFLPEQFFTFQPRGGEIRNLLLFFLFYPFIVFAVISLKTENQIMQKVPIFLFVQLFTQRCFSPPPFSSHYRYSTYVYQHCHQRNFIHLLQLRDMMPVQSM